MNHIQLNKTDLKVSPICLGTSQFGTSLSRDLALWQLDAFADAGGNFLDTALVYGDWGTREKAVSEKIIGQWLKKSGKKDSMIIMTKGAHPLLETMHLTRCTPKDIKDDITSSLTNLGVDKIDLYLLHRDNTSLPVDALLETLEEAKLQGKIAHYGFSNWSYERIKEAESYAAKNKISGFVCNQIKWSLADTNTDQISDKNMLPMGKDFYKWHKETGINVTAYNSTARAWFTKLESGIKLTENLTKLYDNETNKKIYSYIKEAAAELKLSVLDISLAYIRSHSFPSIPITSFSSKEQLTEALASCDVILPEELVGELNGIKGLKSRS